MLDEHQIEYHIVQASIWYLLTKYWLLATKVHDQKNLQMHLLKKKQSVIGIEIEVRILDSSIFLCSMPIKSYEARNQIKTKADEVPFLFHSSTTSSLFPLDTIQRSVRLFVMIYQSSRFFNTHY
jgi:hypothetical protein